MGDVLGGVFSELDLGNKWAGQFFTPDPVCRMMAAMTFDSSAREKPAVTLGASEPCVGGGAMVIALARELRSQGINY
ncbi:MAG: N-6 DNA methylase [Pseudolabrys sp.]